MNNMKATVRCTSKVFPASPYGIQELRRSQFVEVFLPEQLFVPALESAAVWTGERRLLLAVLQEAVHTFLTYRDVVTQRRQRLFHEVQAWFWSEQSDWLYAFESICSHLHLDPDYIRRGLQRGQRPIEPLLHGFCEGDAPYSQQIER